MVSLLELEITLPADNSSTESKGTVAVTVTAAGSGVSGAKITLTKSTDSSKTYISTASGTAGGCSIADVPYGTYKVSVSTLPTGYTAPTTIDNLVVDAATETLAITLTPS